MVTMRASSAPTCSGLKCSATAAYSSAGTFVWDASVTHSVNPSAARSRSVKNGDSRQTETAMTRCMVSPAARASEEWESTQYEQPFSWEARSRTSSRRAVGKPDAIQLTGCRGVQMAQRLGERGHGGVDVKADGDACERCR